MVVGACIKSKLFNFTEGLGRQEIGIDCIEIERTVKVIIS